MLQASLEKEGVGHQSAPHLQIPLQRVEVGEQRDPQWGVEEVGEEVPRLPWLMGEDWVLFQEEEGAEHHDREEGEGEVLVHPGYVLSLSLEHGFYLGVSGARNYETPLLVAD